MPLSEVDVKEVTPDFQEPIGIFDSGIGGLSVLRHIRAQLPNESVCYFADAGFAPYGDKPESIITERTLLIADFLISRGIKALVVACNTATAAAIRQLRTTYPDLILIGVEPGIKPAASLSQTGCVGVLATSSTLASSKYQELCTQIQQHSQVTFIHQACPGLMDLIEQGQLDTPATFQLMETYLRPMLHAGADTIVLGCTHYPFVESTIRHIAAAHNRPDIHLIDTGMAVARQLQRLLTEQHKLAESAPNTPVNTPPAPGMNSKPAHDDIRHSTAVPVPAPTAGSALTPPATTTTTTTTTQTFFTSGSPAKLTAALEHLLHISAAEYTLAEMFSI